VANKQEGSSRELKNAINRIINSRLNTALSLVRG
jgi:hypothetical protein